jgi:predicted deacylase
VLDLHCDNEAVLHLYTATPLWPEVEPLARLLGCAVSLLATHSGDNPFDEACSMLWPRLSEQLAARDPGSPALPDACVAVTVELRGEVDVHHRLAAADCEALLAWLALRGQITGPWRQPITLAPALVRPLAGSMPVVAPHGGLLVFTATLGQSLRAGQTLAELIDPLTAEVTELVSPVDGLFYACDSRRFVPAGTRVAKVAGAEPLRSGKLLSA